MLSLVFTRWVCPRQPGQKARKASRREARQTPLEGLFPVPNLLRLPPRASAQHGFQEGSEVEFHPAWLRFRLLSDLLDVLGLETVIARSVSSDNRGSAPWRRRPGAWAREATWAPGPKKLDLSCIRDATTLVREAEAAPEGIGGQKVDKIALDNDSRKGGKVRRRRAGTEVVASRADSPPSSWTKEAAPPGHDFATVSRSTRGSPRALTPFAQPADRSSVRGRATANRRTRGCALSCEANAARLDLPNLAFSSLSSVLSRVCSSVSALTAPHTPQRSARLRPLALETRPGRLPLRPHLRKYSPSRSLASPPLHQEAAKKVRYPPSHDRGDKVVVAQRAPAALTS